MDQHQISSVETTPIEQLCSKCQKIFSDIPIKPKESWKSDYFVNLPVHSPSVKSLYLSKGENCHLCILLWDSQFSEFEKLLQEERETNSVWVIRFRWATEKYSLLPCKTEAKSIKFVVNRDYSSASSYTFDEAYLSIRFWLIDSEFIFN